MTNVDDTTSNYTGEDSLVLTDAETRMVCRLSQELGSLRALRRVLGISCMRTLDSIVAWRSRRVRPATIARIRVALRREAARRMIIVHEVLQ